MKHGITQITWPVLFAGLFFSHCEVSFLEDRTTDPLRPASDLEQIASLDDPPGNISIASDGRIFISFFPEAKPPVKVAELVNGEAIPFPSMDFQERKFFGEPWFDTVLSIRVDSDDRLWTLDYAGMGIGQPRLMAFDIDTGEILHDYPFPDSIAPKDSLLNDMQIDLARGRVYITDTSPIINEPALIVYDIENQTARRLFEDHPSTVAPRYQVVVDGEPLEILGYPVVFNADSIGLDPDGNQLYFAPFSSGEMFRIPAGLVADFSNSESMLAANIDYYAPKTMSDGMSVDVAGNLILADPEHSAINIITPDRELVTLFKTQTLRFPDGFSYGPDGKMYVTCSALDETMLQPRNLVEQRGPYPIFRFDPVAPGVVGR